MDGILKNGLLGVAAPIYDKLTKDTSQEDMNNAVKIAMEQERQSQAQQKPTTMKKGGKVAGQLATRGYGMCGGGMAKGKRK